jgi:predicted nucleic acid-binding protein
MLVASDTSPISNLAVIGRLGLLRAKLEGAIPSLKAELETLRDRARFFVARHLEERILQSAREM